MMVATVISVSGRVLVEEKNVGREKVMAEEDDGREAEERGRDEK